MCYNNITIMFKITKGEMYRVKTFCIYNNKGGVGKTSVTGAISVELVIKGKRVLMVDTDTQANLTKQFLSGVTIDYELADFLYDDSLGLKNCIYSTNYDNLFIIPTKDRIRKGRLFEWNTSGVLDERKDDVVNYLVEDAQKLGFDYFIFDTPPSLSKATQKYIKASDEVIPVLQIAKSSLDGLANFYIDLKELRGRKEKPICNKMIFNQYEKSKAVQKALLPGIMELQNKKYLIPVDQGFKKAELQCVALQELGMKNETQEVLNQIISDIEE